MNVLDTKIKSLENSLLDLENKDVLKSVLEKARTVAEAQERKRGDENLKRYRERRNESAGVRKYRERVRSEVENLRKWLMAPSNKDVKKHVPAELQKTVADFLESINFMSKTALRSGGLETTKADEKYLKNMKKLRDAIKSNVDGNDMYRYAYFNDEFIENFEALIAKAEEHIGQHTGEYVVNQMTAGELRELARTLKTLRKIITTMNEFHNNAVFQHDYEAGEETISHLAEFEKSKKSGFLHKFFSFDYMRPSYAFERFGKGGQSIEHEFREGQAVQARLANAIIDFAKKTYTAKEVKAWSEETKSFTLNDGETVTLPITHIMSLYCLNKRDQALTHIYGDGIRIANYKNGRQVQLDEGHMVTIADVQKMIDSLTDRQKAVADALQKYMSTDSAAWGNYVSMARFDVEQFTEKNYFPINSDGRYLPATAD
jgi:molecular chaperone GrpE (heat shock protein)